MMAGEGSMLLVLWACADDQPITKTDSPSPEPEGPAPEDTDETTPVSSGDTAEPPVGRARMSGEYSRADAQAVILGDDREAGIGYALTSAGDVNGDGFADILLGNVGDDSFGDQSGRLLVFHGPLQGDVELSEAVAEYTGTSGFGSVGNLVATAGDINGDGYDDLLGEAFRDATLEPYAGMAFVVFGPLEGSHPAHDADILLHGDVAGEGMGFGIAGIGDTNGDGRADIATGAHLLHPGMAYVWHESLLPGQWTPADADAAFVGEAVGGDEAGAALAGLGDATGDGLTDLLIADYWAGSGQGAAYLVHGPFSGTRGLEDAEASIRGTAGQHLAIRVAGGDLDGDGLGDAVLDRYSPRAIFLFPGSSTGALTEADASARVELSGIADQGLACPGDVDGDGYDDLLLGAPNTSPETGRGAAALYYGPLQGELTDEDVPVWFVAEVDNEGVGSVGGAGDVDGDGYPDILIGAGGAEGRKGAAYLFTGE
jgi:hypothetical protein